MTIEVTTERLAELSALDGKISIEGEPGSEEIVVRLKPSSYLTAEEIYDCLLDIASDDPYCESCGERCAEGRIDGLCVACNDRT